MAGIFRRLRDVTRCVPRLYRGSFQMKCSRSFVTPASTANLLNCLLEKSHDYDRVKGINGHSFRRYTAATEIAEASPMEIDLLTFIRSCIDDKEGAGPSHFWLNIEGSGGTIKKDGIFLIISSVFHQDSSAWCCDDVLMIENVKKLQQRYPLLNVMGFQSGISFEPDDYQASLAHLFVKDYVSFPILFSHCHFPQVAEEQCYFICKGFSSPVIYREKGVDLEVLDKAIRDLDVVEVPDNDSKDAAPKQNVVKEPTFQDVYAKEKDSHSLLKSTTQKQNLVKEPFVSSLMRNLFLYFPGCISKDDGGSRIFISDSNHHRIIIVDDKGVIQDCIGSSPGFEDGDFESAKLFRPAASYYDEAKECLYFVDSENHAIRKADLEKRVVETIFPPSNDNKSDGLWSWIKNKAGLQDDNDTNDEDLDPSMLIFPWHLLRSADDEIFVLNRSFEYLWIMDSLSWEVKDVIRGSKRISEVCGQLILDKVSILKQFPHDWLQRQVDNASSLENIPYSNLISTIATVQDDIIVCDTVGQQILKYNSKSGFTNFHFTNLGTLGLPYWLACALEKVYTIGVVRQCDEADYIQSFTLLPGEVQMQIIIDIPLGTELVEPIQEGCIWRQARGAAVEISREDQKEISTERVGIAQQWYDELDSITLLPDSDEEVEEDVEEAKIASISTLRDDQVFINCTANTSPGTSEVIVYASLHLKLKKDSKSNTELSEEDAERITSILKSKNPTNSAAVSFFRSTLVSNKVPRDTIFMKPLHIRIKLFNLDHPKAADRRSTILTDSFIKVNVSLNS